MLTSSVPVLLVNMAINLIKTNMAKILKFPAPVDSTGKPLTVEEINEMSQEPEYIPVELAIGGKKVTFSIAVDFEKIGAEEDRAYQKFKTKMLRTIENISKPDRNTKHTISEEEREEIENNQGVKIMEALSELEPELFGTMIDMILPDGEYRDQIILGHNIPDVPESGEELRRWLSTGTRNARLALESIVLAYDPTNPLVGSMRAGRTAMENLSLDTEETESQSTDQTSTQPTSTSETSSPQSQEATAEGTTVESSTQGTQKQSSTDSPLLYLTSETEEKHLPDQPAAVDSSHGGANHSG